MKQYTHPLDPNSTLNHENHIPDVGKKVEQNIKSVKGWQTTFLE